MSMSWITKTFRYINRSFQETGERRKAKSWRKTISKKSYWVKGQGFYAKNNLSIYLSVYLHLSISIYIYIYIYIQYSSYWLNSFMTEVLIIRNHSIDLLCKSVDWFLYDRNLGRERVKSIWWMLFIFCFA